VEVGLTDFTGNVKVFAHASFARDPDCCESSDGHVAEEAEDCLDWLDPIVEVGGYFGKGSAGDVVGLGVVLGATAVRGSIGPGGDRGLVLEACSLAATPLSMASSTGSFICGTNSLTTASVGI